MSAAHTLFKHSAYPISISTTFAETVLRQAETFLKNANQFPVSTPTICEIKPTTELYPLIKTYIDNVLHVNSDTISVHSLSENQSSKSAIGLNNTNRDTIIIRLDNNCDPRLSVDSILVPESQGSGYYLPKGTPYELTQGLTNRTTLNITLK